MLITYALIVFLQLIVGAGLLYHYVLLVAGVPNHRYLKITAP